MIEIDLKGRVALVTGGSRGIGAAIVRTLARAGAKVAINYRRNESAKDQLVKELTDENCIVTALRADVSDFVEADSLLQNVTDKLGGLDILVNNAGIWEPFPPTDPRAEENWDRTMEINLKSVFNICSQAMPFLKKGGGSVINIASTAGQRGEAGYAAYATSKSGIVGYTKSLSLELAPHQVRVNAVSPGWVLTDMTRGHLEDEKVYKEALEGIPLGKVAQPQDIANAVLFLASDLSSHITGTNLSVNGGAIRTG